MTYVFVMLVGIIGGAVSVFVALQGKRSRVDAMKREQDKRASETKEALEQITKREGEFRRENEVFAVRQSEFDARVISYEELGNENSILKHDLQNIDVNLRKLQLDHQLERTTREALDENCSELGTRYLKDNTRWITSSITPNNFVNCKTKLKKVVEWYRKVGLTLGDSEEAALFTNLQEEYEKAVRAAFEREEQARIKAQIREEQKLEKEIERELSRLDREREAIKAALEKALAEAKTEHSAEVDRLRERLAEAEENSERAVSRAQMTKSGHVYVISNLGSFGEGIFKVGMTRRLEPMDRVKELGDASVPFRFDVHMMISSNNAPALESALHKILHGVRVNKINLRKEFFRTDLETIRQVVEENHGKVQYTVDAEALEYRQTLEMTDEDLQVIEHAYEQLIAEDDDSVTSD